MWKRKERAKLDCLNWLTCDAYFPSLSFILVPIGLYARDGSRSARRKCHDHMSFISISEIDDSTHDITPHTTTPREIYLELLQIPPSFQLYLLEDHLI